MSTAAPTIDEMIASVGREIALRQNVYPRWTAGGKMTKAKAEHELACMKGVLGVLLAHKAISPPAVR